MAIPAHQVPLHQLLLFKAAEDGDVKGVARALAAGANVNGQTSEGWTALHRAASKGRVAAVHALLAAHATVDVGSCDDSSALLIAASDGQPATLAALLDAGADINRAKSEGEGKGVCGRVNVLHEGGGGGGGGAVDALSRLYACSAPCSLCATGCGTFRSDACACATIRSQCAPT
jgi:ankyrin repeat protein